MGAGALIAKYGVATAATSITKGGGARLSKYWIQNSNNVINISNSVHTKVSAYYSSIQSVTNSVILRNWLAEQSFSTQYEWGIKVLRMFGVKL